MGADYYRGSFTNPDGSTTIVSVQEGLDGVSLVIEEPEGVDSYLLLNLKLAESIIRALTRYLIVKERIR